MEQRPDTDLKSELLEASGWILWDLLLKLRFALICAVVGGVTGAAVSVYLGLPMMVGVLPGAVFIGVIGLLSLVRPFRR